MDMMSAMTVSAYGMKAQGSRIRVIAENVAHSGTTAHTPEENPYQRRIVTFKNYMDKDSGLSLVGTNKLSVDQSPFKLKFMPEHPAADEKGYVKMPNVNTLIEMTDLKEAQRSYEANLGVIELSKSMLNGTIELLKN